MKDLIPDHEVEELRKLYRDLPRLLWEATVAIKPDPVAKGMTGSELQRFRQKDAAVVSAMERIRRIVES